MGDPCSHPSRPPSGLWPRSGPASHATASGRAAPQSGLRAGLPVAAARRGGSDKGRRRRAAGTGGASESATVRLPAARAGAGMCRPRSLCVEAARSCACSFRARQICGPFRAASGWFAFVRVVVQGGAGGRHRRPRSRWTPTQLQSGTDSGGLDAEGVAREVACMVLRSARDSGRGEMRGAGESESFGRVGPTGAAWGRLNGEAGGAGEAAPSHSWTTRARASHPALGLRKAEFRCSE